MRRTTLVITSSLYQRRKTFSVLRVVFISPVEIIILPLMYTGHDTIGLFMWFPNTIDVCEALSKHLDTSFSLTAIIPITNASGECYNGRK